MSAKTLLPNEVTFTVLHGVVAQSLLRSLPRWTEPCADYRLPQRTLQLFSSSGVTFFLSTIFCYPVLKRPWPFLSLQEPSTGPAEVSSTRWGCSTQPHPRASLVGGAVAAAFPCPRWSSVVCSGWDIARDPEPSSSPNAGGLVPL